MMSDTKITTISFWNNPGFSGFGLLPIYEERMKITRGSISYRRVFSYDLGGHKKGEAVDYWEIKTSSEEFQRKFDILAESSKCLANLCDRYFDAPIFAVRVTYVDKKYKVFYLPFNFLACGLGHIADLIREMIPEGYRYSEVLEVDDLKEMDVDELNALISSLETRPGVCDDLQKWQNDLCDLLDKDFDFEENMQRIQREKTSEESFYLEDVRTYLTYYSQDRNIHEMEAKIKDGGVLKVLRRLLELEREHEGKEEGRPF